jgi:hypothetical protein
MRAALGQVQEGDARGGPRCRRAIARFSYWQSRALGQVLRQAASETLGMIAVGVMDHSVCVRLHC